jgi:hypothetical protein
MKRMFCFWIAACAALGLSACATTPSPGPAKADTAKACAEWRWIGISRPETRCPDVSGWTVRPLFSPLSPALSDHGKEPVYKSEKAPPDEKADKAPASDVVRELNRFCVYEIEEPGRKLSNVPFPPAVSSDLVRFDQDCAALSLSAEPEPEPAGIAERIAGPTLKDFFAQAGKPEEALEINNWLGVRLAFLDTEPTREGVSETMGNSPHGYILSHIARKLVCTQEPMDHCAVQIATRLALPIVEFDAKSRKHSLIDPGRGGFFGTQSDLAAAIQSEVETWRRLRAQPHLVLNLSMAWDGELFGGLDEAQVAEMRAGTQAVYRALEYAADYDVLVLAAAGNQKREPCSATGPLLPAAWERGAPKQEETCGRSRTRPLVYAVGGLDTDGYPVFNARPGGMPQRAAFAVVKSWNPDAPEKTFAGSSVATAVVSSIAALVWDSFPGLDSEGVMRILDQSGDLMKHPADLWFGAGAPPAAPLPVVHRLSLCAALRKACDENPNEPCPLQAACPTWTPSPPDPSRLAMKNSAQSSCQPWLSPQPEDDPCLACIKPPPERN